jgi:two-component system, NarL family, response regulator DegU
MEPKIRIVLAEDKALMRKSLIALLKEYPLFDVVGEAANGRELLDVLKQVNADIVLLDIEMPVMSGTEALKVIQQRFPELKPIILSIHNNLAYIKDSLALGARGYLPKDCSPDQLEKTILTVNSKGFYIEDQLSKELLHDSVYGMSASSANPKQTFSARELEVLKELSNGKTEKEIAQKLNISRHTVHFHRMKMYVKTNTHNLAGLLKYVSANEALLWTDPQ